MMNPVDQEELRSANLLNDLKWGRLVVRLRNIRNEFSREHPFSVFQSVLKHAEPESNGRSSFVFHPLRGSLGDRIEKGREYELAVVFSTPELQKIACFADSLASHLSDKKYNFDVVSISEPHHRSPATCLAELESTEELTGNLVLDFVGWLDFDATGSRNWKITAPVLFGLMKSRLMSLYGMEMAPLESLWAHIEISSFFWEHRKTEHKPKSGSGGTLFIQGREGPLLLKNVSSKLFPLLAACSELHIGRERTYGRGFYRICLSSSYLTDRARNPREIALTLDDIDEQSDIGQDLARTYFSRSDFVDELANELADGTYQTGKARGTLVPKRKEGSRTVVTLAPKDYVMQKHLHRILAAPIDRMLEECSIGFRPGRSVNTARKIIREAIRDGCGFVVESDIESFFDEIDWSKMLQKIESSFPPGEGLTISLIDQAIRMSLETAGRPVERSKGLLQGSPLSPLLSNLYLDRFDETMLSKGYRLVRYADDFVVLTRTREEADNALNDMRSFLAGEGLILKEEKTSLRPVELGFTFLGVTFSGDSAEDFVEHTALRKPLYIRPIYGFAGLDYDSVIVKKKNELIQRRPLHRISEIIIFGMNTVSTRLLHKCSCENIPITFCTPSGGFMNTLAPDSRRFHDMAARHSGRHYSLSERDKVTVACDIVRAKLHNYRAWITKRFGEAGKIALQAIDGSLEALSGAQDTNEVRGYEGAAAKQVFALVAKQVACRGFESGERIPFKKRDQLNSLLDFAYFLLTARLNVLIRGKGLNPYLGFLHSEKDYYESLVYDIAEPFRFRMDRMVIRMIMHNRIKPQDLTKAADKGRKFFLSNAAAGKFIESFEQELETSREGETSLSNLLRAQVQQVVRWVEGDPDLRIYRL